MTSLQTSNANRTAVTLGRWYDQHGVPQLPEWEAAIGGDRAWVRLARCGSWQADAPDPELFFSLDADSAATYAAQAYCADCPVRRVCQADADRAGAPGVRGGMYRRDDGRVAPLCAVRGCTRYRMSGRSARACSVCATRTQEMREAISQFGTPPTNLPVAREVVPAPC